METTTKPRSPSQAHEGVRGVALLLTFPLALAILAAVPSLMLLAVCTTRQGTVFAIAAVLLCVAAGLACQCWGKASHKLKLGALLAFTGWICGTGWLAFQAPDGHTVADSPIQNRYLHDQWAFKRYPLGNLLPEVDQLALGFKLAPFIDSLFTMEQSKVLSALTASIYRELEADPNFHALGSVMPEAYDEVWRQPFNHGHYFLYVPPTLNRHQPHPAMVFLQGSGGNFKAYTWLLSKVADELGIILIAPSYGIGNWHEPDTSALIQSVLEDAAKIASIDQDQLHLMGLSNGGLGVSLAGRALGDKFQSLTFLSPVFQDMSVSSPEFTGHWRGRPVLVISGILDDRVPFNYVAATVEMMQRAGIAVTLKPVDNAGHFMLFSHRGDVIKTITGWLRERLATPSPAPKQSF